MNRWDELIKLCPRLYKNGMVFECGPGWFDIIRILSINIELILKENEERKEIPSDEELFWFEMFATQVKEKYGRLCFYMSFDNERIHDLIEEASSKTTQTCEVCGELGKMRGEKWFEVRCDGCWNGR